MALTITGTSKLLTLDTATSFDFRTDIYRPLVDWSCLHDNMQYLLPCQGSGKITLGGGVYTDLIFTLLNGWKLKPSGYTNGDQISVVGTLVTSDSSVPTVAPTVGGYPQWLFKVATNGIITAVGSGLTTDEHNKLYGIDTKIGTPTTDLATSTNLIPALL